MNNIEIPEIILLIEKLQEIRLFDTEKFEFYIDYRNEMRYHCCPIDAIPFARTGHNGIHLAFLTDFKIEFKLHELPIICIAPSYDPCVNYVAENINDFISLLMTVQYSTMLAEEYTTNEQYIRIRNEYTESYRNEFDNTDMSEQASFIRNKFGLSIVEDVFKYLEEIKLKRMKKFPTYSSKYSRLGVCPFNNELISGFKLEPNLVNISDFLNSNNRSSRLQFYRDCAAGGISISGDKRVDIRKTIQQYLLNDGYVEIANNLNMY